jgi:hypothetical protein
MARGDWQETRCSSCGTTVPYHVDWDRVPDLCRDCIADKKREQAKWHETRCVDCGTTIKYHEDWNRIPDLCKGCLAERKAKWQEKSCADCGGRIRYHIDWDRIPDICRSCADERRRKREEAQAKWRETSCSRCRATIKYHTDWNRIPDLCKSCIEIVKEERAKWHEKNCACCGTSFRYHQDWNKIPDYCRECNVWLTKTCEAEGCNEEIRYKKYWSNIPVYCRPCKSGERAISEQRPRDDGGWDEYTGWGYVNRNGVIVFVDDGPNGKHSHTVYRADGTLVGYREEGQEGDWNNELWKYTSCKECGSSIRYHVDWDRVPDLCDNCRSARRNERANRQHNQEPSLPRHIETGIDGEMRAEAVALRRFGFQQTAYSPPAHGIDRIFRDGNDLVIIEAKSVAGFSPSGLHPVQSGSRQMDKDWIRRNAERMAHSGVRENEKLGKEILSRLNPRNNNQDSIRRIIINTDPRTGDVTCYESTNWDSNAWQQIDPLDG